jgi:hypothetical protein
VDGNGRAATNPPLSCYVALLCGWSHGPECRVKSPRITRKLKPFSGNPRVGSYASGSCARRFRAYLRVDPVSPRWANSQVREPPQPAAPSVQHTHDLRHPQDLGLLTARRPWPESCQSQGDSRRLSGVPSGIPCTIDARPTG